MKNNEIKEHPLYNGYYGWFDKQTVISIIKGLPKELTQSSTKEGYKRLTIKTNNKNKRLFLHRFLWECFTSKLLSPHEEIDHKDFNPSNNSIENLQILSKTDNILKSCTKKTIVTFEDGEEKFFSSQIECARYFNVPIYIIRYAVNHNTKIKKLNISKIISLSFKE